MMLTSQRAATTARCGPPHNSSALPLGRSEAQEAPEMSVWLPPPAMHCFPALSRQSQPRGAMHTRSHYRRTQLFREDLGSQAICFTDWTSTSIIKNVSHVALKTAEQSVIPQTWAAPRVAHTAPADSFLQDRLHSTRHSRACRLQQALCYKADPERLCCAQEGILCSMAPAACSLE